MRSLWTLHVVVVSGSSDEIREHSAVCYLCWTADTEAPLLEVSTVPLVVSFQVEMSESELRPDTVLTMICHKAAGLVSPIPPIPLWVAWKGRRMLDLCTLRYQAYFEVKQTWCQLAQPWTT